MTVFHLVRHAEHGLLGRTLTGRVPGIGLNENGRAQAGRMAAVLAGRHITAVRCSPQQRAQETAGPIAAALGVAVHTDPAWDEVDFGAWSGQDFADLQHDPAWHAWNNFRSTAPTPGGETMLTVQSRAVAALASCQAADPDGEVLVVSHLDVLRAVLAHALGMPLDLMFRIELAPASRSMLALWDTGVRVDGVGLPS